MKKNNLLTMVLAGTLCCAGAAFAEESQSMPPGEGDGGKMMKKGGMGMGMMHNKPSVVATSDGGIVVLDGPRLIKYDAQLNLVGEAELKPGKKPSRERKEEAPEVELPAGEAAHDHGDAVQS